MLCLTALLVSGCASTGQSSSGGESRLPVDCDGRDAMRYHTVVIDKMTEGEVKMTLSHNEKVKAYGCAK